MCEMDMANIDAIISSQINTCLQYIIALEITALISTCCEVEINTYVQTYVFSR